LHINGYNINLIEINPVDRENSAIVIYAKIESERFLYSRLNQSQLCTSEYHTLDDWVNDNGDTN
jgi:hypothetical protein